MKKRFKKGAACLLAAAMLTGNCPVLLAAPEVTGLEETTMSGEIPARTDTIQTEAALTSKDAAKSGVTLTLKGTVLLAAGSGALTQTAENAIGKEKLSGVTEIRVESGITEIGASAFKGLKNVKTVSLPDGLKSIGTGAFWGCSSLTKLSLPDSVTGIAEGAFRECTSLAAVDFGKNLSSIGRFAFYRCTALTSVKLPDTVKTLGTGAFQECTSLVSASLGEGVTKLPIQLFRGCRKLEIVVLGSGVEEFGEQCFCLCTSLKNFRIPDSVVQVDKNAFASCGDLELTMSDDLESQGDGSYRKRGGLRIMGTFLYSEAEKMLSLVNQERAAAGLALVTMDRELLDGAMTRSAELNVSYSDQRPNGASFDSVSSKASAENRLIGVTSARDAMEIWMASGGYRSRILDPEVKSIGIGCFSQGDTNTRCWVQLFGKEAADPAGSKTDVSQVVDIRAASGTYSFYLKESSLEIKPGEKKTLTVLLKNPGFSKAPAAIDPSTFVWESSDSGVVKVDEKGNLTPVKGGNAVITCTSRYGDRQTLTCQVTVSVKVTSIRAETRNLRLAVGKRYQAKVWVYPTTATNRSLKYRSSKPSVVSVDASGKLWAKKKGTATITCTALDGSGTKMSFNVTVKNYVSTVRVLNAPKDLTAGESIRLQTQVIPSDAVNTSVTFKSSNSKIASVSSKGVVKALRPGKVNITCSSKYGAGTSKTITITVHPKAPSLTVRTAKGKAVFTWKRSAGTKLSVLYWSTKPGSGYKRLYKGSETTFTQNGLKKGKTYYFKLRCVALVDKKYVSSPASLVLKVKGE